MSRSRYKQITYKDRQKIEKLFKNGLLPPEISKIVGCSKETIYQEEARGWDVVAKEYSAFHAQLRVGIPIEEIRELNKKENKELQKKQRKEER